MPHRKESSIQLPSFQHEKETEKGYIPPEVRPKNNLIEFNKLIIKFWDNKVGFQPSLNALATNFYYFVKILHYYYITVNGSWYT